MAQRAEQVREGRAVAKFIRMSAFKTRRAADLIRGKPVQEARRVLAFSPLRGSTTMSKVLESAIANATNNFGLDETRLVVHTAVVDEGPTLKRWRPAAHGRAYRIRKRMSHITVVVRQLEEPAERKPEKKAEAKADKQPRRRTKAAETDKTEQAAKTGSET